MKANPANRSQAGQRSNKSRVGKQSQNPKASTPARASASNLQAPGKPAAATLPAAPGEEYLKMVAARLRAMPGFQERGSPLPALRLNLPGLACGIDTGPKLFDSMIGDLHWCADKIRAGLLPRLGSAWELVELEELLAISADISGDDSIELPKDSSEPVPWDIRESSCLMHRATWTLRETMVFGAFVLHWHAAAISELVLPQLKLTDAVQLAQSLVIAEHVVTYMSNKGDAGRSPGSLAQPTALQAQAWTLAARLWTEWPRGKSFGELLDGEADDPVGELVGLASNESAPTVAP